MKLLKYLTREIIELVGIGFFIGLFSTIVQTFLFKKLNSMIIDDIIFGCIVVFLQYLYKTYIRNYEYNYNSNK